MKWLKSWDQGLTWSWTPSPPSPHPSNLIHTQAHTGDPAQSLLQSKSSFNVISFQFHKYPFSFLIIVLFILYSGFLECSLPKHLCGSFLLFSFFLAKTNHQRSFPWAHFLKQIYAIPLIFSFLSLFIFKQDSYLIYCLLFLTGTPLLQFMIFERNCLFCPLLYFLPIENIAQLTFYVLFAQKNVSSCSYLIVHFGFHFLIKISIPEGKSCVLCIFQFHPLINSFILLPPYILNVILPIASQWVL